MRVRYPELHDVLRRALEKTGLAADRADACARLIADSTRDGVPSHGVNLVPRLIAMMRAGTVDVTGRSVRVAAHGPIERWDGRSGVGALNASDSMAAAIALARTHGIGCVALANTNHWMRGGTYGWQAADAGVIGICWTNTLPNLPPWGASDPRIGNNPLVIAVPRSAGHVVLDMALSQFSYGALAQYRMRGELLPVPGGYDTRGELTRDPAEIEATRRPLPIGFWKGSGLSIMLDLIAAVLSGGSATHQVPVGPEKETALSQVFIAFDVRSLPDADASRTVDAVLEHLRMPARDGERVRYPGERTLETRTRHLAEGIPIEPSMWEFLQNLRR